MKLDTVQVARNTSKDSEKSILEVRPVRFVLIFSLLLRMLYIQLCSVASLSQIVISIFSPDKISPTRNLLLSPRLVCFLPKFPPANPVVTTPHVVACPEVVVFCQIILSCALTRSRSLIHKPTQRSNRGYAS